MNFVGRVRYRNTGFSVFGFLLDLFEVFFLFIYSEKNSFRSPKLYNFEKQHSKKKFYLCVYVCWHE